MVAYTDSLGFYKNSAGFPANYTDRVSVDGTNAVTPA